MTGRVLYPADRVAAMIRALRAEEAVRHDDLMSELHRLQGEVRELRGVIDQMRAARLAVEHAQAELAGLYRQREIERAQLAYRPFGALLQ